MSKCTTGAGMLTSRKGFTLVEMIVVMTVFVIVIMITGDAFKTILTQVLKVTKSEESNIEGVVGLEMLRHDLQQAGYGLPYSFLASISYREAGYSPARDYNDGTGSTTSAVPRAVVAGDNLAAVTDSDGTTSYNILSGTDYLALKGATLGLNDAAQKWTYMPFSSAVTGKQKPRIWQAANLAANDRVIVIKRTFKEGNIDLQLMFNRDQSSIYWANFDATGFADANFSPTLPEELYFIYGIRNASSGTELGMPFNRADYFVAKPATATKIPPFCAENTGILYKGVVNHTTTSPGGRMSYVPLLDCVADMQVVFGWDLDDGQGNEGQDGLVDTYSTPLSSGGAITVSPSAHQTRVTTAMADPEKLRTGLKLVKVYLLAQNGRRDAGYQSPASFTVGDASIDAISKTYTLTAEMQKYRWKVYRVIVRPKNLVSNQ